jgi:hypothetical protein
LSFASEVLACATDPAERLLLEVDPLATIPPLAIGFGALDGAK